MATSRADTDACEFCGSTNFHLDNGLLYCDNGHEQAVRPHRKHSIDLGKARTLIASYREGSRLLMTRRSMVLKASELSQRRIKAK